MPEISRFYGIIIKIFAGDHPPPHFHVVYGEFNAVFDMKTINLIEGDIPIRVQKLVKEWGNLHKTEILEIWENQKFHKISPLL